MSKVSIKPKGGNIFEELHRKGAEEFGVIWLDMNEAIVNGAHAYSLNPANPAVKEFLSHLALTTLRTLKARGHLTVGGGE